MPEFVYAGQVPRSYTELRDEHGGLVGTVEHGDARDFGGDKPEGAPDFWPAPDGLWAPAGTKIAPPWPGVSADMYRPGDGGQAASAGSEPEAPAPPAETEPPAPPAGRVTSATAALTGTSGEEH